MIRSLKMLGAGALASLLMFTSLTTGYAAGPSPDAPTPGEPKIEMGQVTSISPAKALGKESAANLSANTQCNQQDVIAIYPELRFTGTKRWCFDGRHVISGTMAVKTYIKPDYRYTKNQDGFVYVPGALKKTDRFLTHRGVRHGAHLSTRTGRFEYRIHGQSKPQVVYIPFVSRTGYGTGKCNGPKPKDLAPKIISIYPKDGQRGVERSVRVVAELNMEAKKGTANPSTFYMLNQKTGAYIEAKTGRYTKDERFIVIYPDKPLQANATYDVTIAAGPYGVLGKTGDPLIKGMNWSFKTGSK